ncbi:MAG: DNA translocase FtsK [Chloroflexi bacterium]|nr:DNA translocase FtsK [Chloroflexota bacterium]
MTKKSLRGSPSKRSSSKSSSRRTSKPSSRRTSGRRTSGRRKSKQPSLPSISLTLDQQLDIVGYGLLIVAGFTLLSFLSANRGVITGKWLGLLQRTFGWGAYLTPLFVGAVGLWLVLRDFGDRLPRLTPQQIVGVLLGYLALLTTLHSMVAFSVPDGDVYATLRSTAEAGRGGGYLGAEMSWWFLDGLGGVGTMIVLITWWLIVVALFFGLTVQNGMDVLERLLEPLRGQRRSARPKSQPSSFPASASITPDKRDADPRPPSWPSISTPQRPSASTAAPVSSSSQSQLIGGDHAWQLPALDEILDPGTDQDIATDILRRQARIIEDTLRDLGAPVRVQETNPGPVVTQFAIEPLVTVSNGKETKVKVSRIRGLADDLALALEARTLRVEAPIPGKGLIGIEVPNPHVSLVALRDVIESEAFAKLDSPLRVGMGHDVSGHPAVADLTAMPHLLIAGTTGSGKSVCINALIAALLLQNTPADLEFLMIDPKRVELTGYNGIPHLQRAKVVVEMERVTSVLRWVLEEMDRRYRGFSKAGATNIRDYNERVAPRLGDKRLPYIVVIIDELADLMMMAPQETERSVCRIAQMARATGIHLVIATQRPSVDVVTGLIKANFPARIAFNVASSVDSRVILDMPGAEQLLGRGDMLFLPPDAATPLRLQGACVSDEELRRLVHYWKGQARPEAVASEKTVQQPLWEEMRLREQAVKFEDELLPDVIDLVLREQRASVSLLQRKLRIGYTRASRIMDILEQHNVVGPQPSGGRAREVFPGAARKLLNPGGE